MRQGRRTERFLALLCMCMMIWSAASADWQIEMFPTEWTWEANGVAAFSGVIKSGDGDVNGAVLTLSIDTRMEDSGEVMFTNLNGKKVKIRKRSSTAEMDLAGGGAENTFEGEWYLPAEVEEGLSSAVIHLSLTDAEGKELAKQDMQVGSQEEDAVSAGESPANRLDKLYRILLYAGIAVWVLALGRFALLRKRQTKNA